jgi:hypothetical protein
MPCGPVDRRNVQPGAGSACLRRLLFDPEDGGNIFLRDVDEILPDDTSAVGVPLSNASRSRVREVWRGSGCTCIMGGMKGEAL